MLVRIVNIEDLDFVAGGIGRVLDEMRDEARRRSPTYHTQRKPHGVHMTEAHYDKLKAIAAARNVKPSDVLAELIEGFSAPS